MDISVVLGYFEDFLPYLREAIEENWDIIERRRNPDNNFVRVDIVKNLKRTQCIHPLLTDKVEGVTFPLHVFVTHWVELSFL